MINTRNVYSWTVKQSLFFKIAQSAGGKCKIVMLLMALPLVHHAISLYWSLCLLRAVSLLFPVRCSWTLVTGVYLA